MRIINAVLLLSLLLPNNCQKNFECARGHLTPAHALRGSTLEYEILGRASCLSTLFCPSSGVPRVISGIGRILCAAFRARKRFVICASVVYIGGVLWKVLFSFLPLAALYSPRSRDSTTRPGVLGSKLLQHPEISHSCRVPAGEQWPGRPIPRFQRPPPRCL